MHMFKKRNQYQVTGPVILPLTVRTVAARIKPFLACVKPLSLLFSFCPAYLVKPCFSVSQVRLRCQKGIPPALRGRAWLYLSGGKVKREQNQGKFQVWAVYLSLPPYCFRYAVFRAHFIFKFHWKLLLKLVMPPWLLFWLEPWFVLHRVRASWL